MKLNSSNENKKTGWSEEIAIIENEFGENLKRSRDLPGAGIIFT